MPRPLRVAVVARAVMPLHGLGGLERSVRDLVRHLADRGVDVTLIVPPAHASGATPATIRSPRRASACGTSRTSRSRSPIGAARRCSIAARRTCSTACAPDGWRRARARGRGRRHPRLRRQRARRRGRTPLVPLVLNPQGPRGVRRDGRVAAARQAPRLRAAALGGAARARAGRRGSSPPIARSSRRSCGTSRPGAGQLVTIPNGIDLRRTGLARVPADGAAHAAAPRHRRRRNRAAQRGPARVQQGIRCAGRSAGPRGGRFARSASWPWRWVIVGAGPFRREIETAIDRRGITKRVLMVGRASEADLHAWYEAASVFVHPTRYEGSSLVTLEAMGHRRAVIATRAGGLPDKVRARHQRLARGPEDVAGLADALAEAAADRARLVGDGTRGPRDRRARVRLAGDRRRAPVAVPNRYWRRVMTGHRRERVRANRRADAAARTRRSSHGHAPSGSSRR